MSEKNHKKTVELLRILLHEGKADKNQELAKRLGMSESTFQKTAAQLNAIIHNFDYLKMPATQAIHSITQTIFYTPYEETEMAIYRIVAQSPFSSDKLRKDAAILQVIATIGPATAVQIEQECFRLEEEISLSFQEKYVGRTIKRFVELGLVKRFVQSKGRKKVTYYRVEKLFEELSDQTLKNLYYFIVHCRHVSLFPALAYAIEQKVLASLQTGPPNMILYPYHYIGRFLDDPILLPLVEAIQKRKIITFYYSSVKKQRKFIATFSNELKEKTVYPIRLIYDDTNSRWYLIALDEEKKLTQYRADYIYQVKHEESFKDDVMPELDDIFETSWNVSTDPIEHVIVRFYQENTDFIERRVTAQGAHGRITKRLTGGFLWEIDINGTTEIIPWLRSFGASAEVLSPPSLREAMLENWREMEAMYRDYASLQ